MVFGLFVTGALQNKKMPLEMFDKGSWIPRSSSLVLGWFRFLVFIVILGILTLWAIDDLGLGGFQRDFIVFKLNTTSDKSLPPEVKDFSFSDVTQVNPRSHQNLSNIHENVTKTHEDMGLQVSPTPADLGEEQFKSSNLSSPVLGDKQLETHVESGIVPWISAEFEENYSSKLLEHWLAPGEELCNDSRTVDIQIAGLDDNKDIELSTGEVHEFSFQALDESKKPVCLGGDYFEIDLSGENWKSRPPVKDFGNGSYTFSLQVHQDFEGVYNLTLILLFRHFAGLKFSPAKSAFDRVLRVTSIEFRVSSAKLPEISQCKKSDFYKDVWSGRWTRHAKNDSCPISPDGRYRCQESNFSCQHPWCDGPMGLIESNGWVYSAHCSFKMFTSEEAWNFLSNRWIFWWGDSNHCDTIRNILNFILDVQSINTVPRRFEMNITNPANPSQTVRITSIFNGHWNESGNYQGLNSLINEDYRDLLKSYFSGEVVPDTVIMNSGLHDGIYWPTIRRFINGAEYAAAFWAEVLEGVKNRGVKQPEVIYRTTIATAGYARRLAYNPQKMETFNGVVLDKLRKYKLVNRVIDDFDMTFPWHYDNRANDGVHYGRAPLKKLWRDGLIGHQYFVDLMLGHVLLNALCTK